ncbi:MAG: M15 family metallopeptidase [Bacillota bacterium]|nr:M15 family metallopeptidase [Bacillota bacterium]
MRYLVRASVIFIIVIMAIYPTYGGTEMRQLFQEVGASVLGDRTNNSGAVINLNPTELIPLNKKLVTVSGQEVSLVTPAHLMAKKSFGPIRTASEAIAEQSIEQEDESPPATPSEETVTGYKENIADSKPAEVHIITHPDDILVLVNKTYALPEGYVPPNLTRPEVPFSTAGDHPRKLLRQEAATALEELFKRAEEEGVSLIATSGYRSYNYQKNLFDYYSSLWGEEEANKSSARPGQSEHQTGLAIDVSSPSVQNQLVAAFGDTEEGLWLAKNAPDFGFIIRYPKDKTHITGYIYEPWHLRYVGIEVAHEVTELDITFDEYIAMQ